MSRLTRMLQALVGRGVPTRHLCDAYIAIEDNDSPDIYPCISCPTCALSQQGSSPKTLVARYLDE